MSITTLIVDDEPLGRRAIADLCRREHDVEVVGSCGTGREALEFVERCEPALLLLDVRMKPMNGLEVAAALPTDRTPAVVFVTAYDEYAVRAFELNALDYLLKPVDERRFAMCVERVRRQVARGLNEAQRSALRELAARRSSDPPRDPGPVDAQSPLALEVDGRVVFVRVGEIEYVEADGNYVRVRVNDDVHTVRSTLADVELRLPASQFLRLRRGVIVNLAHVRSMERAFHGQFAVETTSRRSFMTGRAYRERLQSLMLRSKAQRSARES